MRCGAAPHQIGIHTDDIQSSNTFQKTVLPLLPYTYIAYSFVHLVELEDDGGHEAEDE